MLEYRYTLERYKGPSSRHTCPTCGGKKCFARYVDISTGEYLADHVGRCNKEVKCSHHYKPAEYFADNKDRRPVSENKFTRISPQPKPQIHIPLSVLNKSMEDNSNNVFINFLRTLFEPRIVSRLVVQYRIGSSNGAAWWNKSAPGESTVFWFINIHMEVRYGQVKLFKTDGHTDKYTDHDNDLSSCTTGVHTLLKQGYKKLNKEQPVWLTGYYEYMYYDKALNCLFGEHLLTAPENKDKPVAIVESPKTAIVASVFLPGYVWLASGSLAYLTEDRCQVLRGRDVTLFPDLGAFDKWNGKALELGHITTFTTSNILETIATEEQRRAGWDLCDWLVGDEARREIIDACKDAILDENPQTDEEYHAICRRYIEVGLRRKDFQLAIKELLAEYDFEIVDTDQQPSPGMPP